MGSNNVVVIQQPGTQSSQHRFRPAPQNIRDFSDSLCACCNDSLTCFTGWFCLPFLACHVARKMGENCLCVGVIAAPVTWVAMRTKLRTMYGIKGSISGDCMSMCCCPCLSISQMNRELNKVSQQTV